MNNFAWKIRKSMDIVKRNSKNHKNLQDFLAFLFRDSACSEHENKMADGADEEDEVFEITDFTTSSEWERFAARLEQLLLEWKLDGTNRKSTSKGKGLFGNFENSKLKPIPNKKDDTDQREGSWGVITDRISFGSYNFVVSYHHLRTRKKSMRNNRKQTEDLEDCLPDAMLEMLDMEFDFPPRAHCLSRWYGLKEFIVISPAEDAEAVDSESKCHLLLSSIGIAATNSKCTIPMFAHVLQQWRRVYYGLCIGGGFRTTFQISQLRRIPSQYGHFAGLLEIFKDKLACPVSPMPPVSLTVRFTYVLDEWTDYAWPQEPPDPSSCLECKVGLKTLGTLPFGACQDPLRELHLSTTWPCLSEEVIVDNSVYSDLDPCHAPQWSVRAKMSENPQCLLGEYLGGYMMLCHRQESTLQLLNKNAMDEDNNIADITHALQKLTEAPPVASLSTAVSSATSRISAMGERSLEEFPIPGNLLGEILKHLFPDADQDLEDLEITQQELLFDKMENSKKTNGNCPQDKFRGLKTAPEESLTFFLAVCICIVYHSYGGLRAVAHLWQEFVLEMRYRWENDIFIPRLKLQPPNLGSCLVHQKLQMLNCCIERKRLSKIHTASQQFATNVNKNSDTRTKNTVSNTETLRKSNSDAQVDRADSQSSVSDDDEFFEAVESQEESERRNGDNSENLKNTEKRNSDLNMDNNWTEDNMSAIKREGCKEPFGDLKLLVSGEPLIVPVTQEPAPMTEDMLEEQAEILTQLGTSAEGARVRAQMQCASLLSDMEAFKAANPGCLLEDFVRWYSPFDWILGPETEEEIEELRKLKNSKEKESSSAAAGVVTSEDSADEGWNTEEIEIPDEDFATMDAKTLMDEAKAGNVEELHVPNKWREQGHLSLRMRIPGNMWVEVWQSARSVPVRRQKRLFNETKEAEKVLHFLAGLKPAEVAFQLFPVLLHAAVLRIEAAGARDIPAVASLLDKVLDKASKLSWEMPKDLPRCEEFVKQLQLCELVVARAHSLRFKFQDALSDKGTGSVDKDVEHFLSALMEKPEVAVIGAGRGPAGRVIHSLFAKQESARMQFASEEVSSPNQPQRLPAAPAQDFPPPTGREYILRTTIPRPRPSSRLCPQRMYCVLTNDEFRLAGAFTDDVIFQ